MGYKFVTTSGRDGTEYGGLFSMWKWRLNPLLRLGSG